MTFAKVNKLFTSKSVSKVQSNQDLTDFVSQYEHGAILTGQQTTVPQESPTTAPAQELFVDNNSFGTDPLRNALGSSWVMTNDSVSVANSAESFTPVATISAHEISGMIPNSSSPGSFNFGGSIENIAISGLLDQVDGIVGQGPYHVFSIPTPTPTPAETTYNFYIQEYENLLGQSEENETSLLDMYGTVLSLTKVGASPELNQAALRLANGVTLAEGLQAPRRHGQPNVPGDSITTFFKRYSTEQLIQSSRYENIIFPSDRLADVNSTCAASRDMFPFYAGFDITMSESGDICENLQSSNFANTLMRNVASTLESGEVYKRQEFIRNSTDGNYRAKIKTWDLIELLDHFDPSFINRTAVLGDEMDLAETFPEEYRQFASTIDKLQFLSNLQNTIQDRSLDFASISSGKGCYTEVVMYRVAKFKKDNFETPFQSFFFFNAPDVDTFSFLDSQVKPGVEYFYKVYSYSIVIGSEYKYNRVEQGEGNVTGVEVENNISLLVAENLIQTTQTFVASRPPIYPESSFRSFIGENKKIQILFQDRSDTLQEMPVMLSAEEVDRMTKIRTAQGALRGQPVKFSNDDGIKVYEVFRTTTPPENILEFSDKLWRRVTEKEILDKVTADTTYYYMFRSVDNHGNVSNPSGTFEVTLIGGVSPYLIVNDYVYPSAEEDMLRKDKKFKRFLRIKPALQQLLLKRTDELTSKDSSADVFNAQLGVASEGTLWGKKYKVRISSMETGKKIDFNIDYNYKFEHRDE